MGSCTAQRHPSMQQMQVAASDDQTTLASALLTALPTELLCHVFSFVSNKTKTEVVQLVCKAFRVTLAVPAISNAYGVVTITPQQDVYNFPSLRQLTKWLTQRQNGISLLGIAGSVHESVAVETVNWVLGSRCTLLLDVQLASVNFTRELLMPHLLPVLKRRLTSLTCMVDGANLSPILTLTSLTSSYLDKVRVADQASHAPWNLVALTVLRLSDCHGSVADLLLIGGLPRLETFAADGCEFWDEGGSRSPDFLLCYTSLQHLTLVDCNLKKLPRMAGLTRLETLDVTCSDLLQKDLRPALSGLQALTGLTTRNILPTDAYVEYVLSIPSLKRLNVEAEGYSSECTYQLSRLSTAMTDRSGKVRFRSEVV